MTIEENYGPRLYLLELLAESLETDDRIPFNFGCWVGKGWKGDPDISCGAPACAVGRATTLPAFRELGLVLRYDILSGFCRGYPVFGDADGYIAMAAVLRISRGEAVYLFSAGTAPPLTCAVLEHAPHIWATAKVVAAHIRKFVALKRSQQSEVSDGHQQAT
jgi:hypothetical protein